MMKLLSSTSSINRLFTSRGHSIVNDIDEADFVALPGGADIDPSLYGHERHPKTFTSVHSDESDMDLYDQATARDLPIVGICRGAQLLCALTGGTLYQHVDGHSGYSHHHVVDLRTEKMHVVNSLHHQMMRPSEDAQILAVASESTYREYMDGDIVQREESRRGEDVEVVWFPTVKGLGFQGHPEMAKLDSECVEYFFQLFNEFIGE
jgi:gamma-glutamyl-gamma-aminobutyrate hydrolase PuuD